MTESNKVLNKILDNIIEDVKNIFPHLSTYEEKIIRENFIIKKESWKQLGQGMKNIINMVTPINFSKLNQELAKALQNDLTPKEEEI
tara:strand:+ start:380 stop:640 length:261 start_codon:yes stop_codon:yes gene_type:complete